MTKDPEFKAPDGALKNSTAKSGKAPGPFAVPANLKAATPTKPSKVIRPQVSRAAAMGLGDFPQRTRVYVDKGKWLAVDPEKHKDSSAVGAWPFNACTFDLTFHTVGENDGQSSYQVLLEGEVVGEFPVPLSKESYAEGKAYSKIFKYVIFSEAAKIEVKAKIGSKDGEEFSGARWLRIGVRSSDGRPLKRKRGRQQVAAVATPEAAVSFNGDLFGERKPDGNGSVEVSGELKQWHKVTLTMDGTFAHEKDNQPNPFTDRRATVIFVHESGDPKYMLPGYFAADGNAAETSAESCTKWRAHVTPDKPGQWEYKFTLRSLVDGKPVKANTRISEGGFTIAPTDKTGRDLRGKGRLQYVGKHYLQFFGLRLQIEVTKIGKGASGYQLLIQSFGRFFSADW
jgi:hypothetical protein